MGASPKHWGAHPKFTRGTVTIRLAEDAVQVFDCDGTHDDLPQFTCGTSTVAGKQTTNARAEMIIGVGVTGRKGMAFMKGVRQENRLSELDGEVAGRAMHREAVAFVLPL